MVSSTVTERDIRHWRRKGVPYEEIGRRLGVSTDDAREVVSRIWRNAASRLQGDFYINELTIALRASAIRLKWSAEEEQQRRAWSVVEWEAPQVIHDERDGRHRPDRLKLRDKPRGGSR